MTLRLLLAAGVAISLTPFAAMGTGRLVASGAPAIQVSSFGAVTVTVEAIATARTGATDRPRVTVTRTIPVGGRMVAAFEAGGADGFDLCQLASVPDLEAAIGRVRWRVEATVETADASTITLALAWERSIVESTPGGSLVPITDQRTVRLRAGDHHVLDLVQAAAGATSPCANVLVRVRAALAEPPVANRKWLTYDLWLTYERAGSERASRHVQLAGPEDAPVVAEFVPFRWGLNGAWADGPSAAGVLVSVRGTVQGYCRPDGAVDLTLNTVRAVAVGETGGAGGGRKQFVLAPQETVAVEIPNPTARLTSSSAGVTRSLTPWAPGVEGSIDTVTVDLDEFFRGSRFRVLVSGRCE